MNLTPRFDLALLMASRLHAEQKRKGTSIPYVSHLLGVAGIALEYGADEDGAISALLHDAIEDCEGEKTRLEILHCFGERVSAIVEGCSDATGPQKDAWETRKVAYLKHLGDATPEVLLVSAADKLHNARSLLTDLRNPEVGERLWGRFNATKEQTLWYYRSLVEAFRLAGGVPAGLLVELDLTVKALEELSGYVAKPHPAPAPGTSPIVRNNRLDADGQAELARITVQNERNKTSEEEDQDRYWAREGRAHLAEFYAGDDALPDR